jgi:hypothetical protein
MTDTPKSSDPSAAPPPAPQTPAPRPEPFCVLLALCVECGQGIELPLPIDQRMLSYVLAYNGWFISVQNQPESPEVPMVLGPICMACAQQVYPPEVFANVEQRRQQLLQAAQAAQAQAAQGER